MFKINLAAFYAACGIVPPNSESAADEAGVLEVKDGTDLANLCRRSGVPNGTSVTLTFPDVCFLPPSAAGPIPIPYPQATLDSINAEVRKSGFPKVKVLDFGKAHSVEASSGNEAGTVKGSTSQTNMGKAQFSTYSPNVMAEGKTAARFSDVMTNNSHTGPASFR